MQTHTLADREAERKAGKVGVMRGRGEDSRGQSEENKQKEGEGRNRHEPADLSRFLHLLSPVNSHYSHMTCTVTFRVQSDRPVTHREEQCCSSRLLFVVPMGVITSCDVCCRHCDRRVSIYLKGQSENMNRACNARHPGASDCVKRFQSDRLLKMVEKLLYHWSWSHTM